MRLKAFDKFVFFFYKYDILWERKLYQTPSISSNSNTFSIILKTIYKFIIEKKFPYRNAKVYIWTEIKLSFTYSVKKFS